MSNKFLTEEEENEDYIHSSLNFTFKGKYKLTIGEVVVTPKYYFDTNDKRFQECLIKETAEFMGMWAIQYHKRMNGFSGFDCINYKLEEKKV